MEEKSEIATGVNEETESNIKKDADAFAYADDGEHATIWAVTRTHPGQAHVRYYRCEAGLCDYDDGEAFTVDDETDTETFARELAEDDPEEAVNRAREFWEGR